MAVKICTPQYGVGLLGENSPARSPTLAQVRKVPAQRKNDDVQ